MRPSRLANFAAALLVACGAARAELQGLNSPYFRPHVFIDYVHAPDRWIYHPVLGAPSFTSRSLADSGPIYRGSEPYAWPVNVSGFADPVSGAWYAYIGRYLSGYKLTPDLSTHCVALRSRDEGKTWEDLGKILPPDPPHTYVGETSPIGHAPDAMVIYADGRYHACFDWTTASTTWENAHTPGPDSNSGAGYAWAERPEGPWHVTERPIITTRGMKSLHGKYKRVYASSIVRRKNDWLVLSDVDSGAYFGWGIIGMTAQRPEGPYSEPKLLLSCEGDAYYPPLVEFFPATTTNDRIVMSGTSVAKNRAPQFAFSAPIEDAMDPAAWRQDGVDAFVIANPTPDVYSGIWGQAFAPLAPGVTLFPSRDKDGFGTINRALHYNESDEGSRVMHLTAGEGPAIVLSGAQSAASEIRAALRVRGTVSLVWGLSGGLGPDAPRSDSSFHPAALREGFQLKLEEAGGWSLFQRAEGTTEPLRLAQGQRAADSPMEWRIEVRHSPEGYSSLRIDDTAIPEHGRWRGHGRLGFLLEPHAAAMVFQYIVGAPMDEARENWVSWLPTEGLLGAAQNLVDWELREGSLAAYPEGMAFVSKTANVRAKWNFHGDTFRLELPRGPEFGVAEVLLDGERVGTIDQHSDTPPGPYEHIAFESPRTFPYGPHAVVVRPLKGRIAIGVLHARIAVGDAGGVRP